MTTEELNKDLPYGATPYTDDTSGLKVDITPGKQLTRKIIYDAEAENIRSAIMKYFTSKPSVEEAPFTYGWMLDLHKEMFGNVWEWAGTMRSTELSLGVQSNQVMLQLKQLEGNIQYWKDNKTYIVHELAAMIHYNAVRIHPFSNGNGRWSRMLANIYLIQNGEQSVIWNEDELAKDNTQRKDYIDAIKKADGNNFQDFFDFHKNTYDEDL